MIALKHYIAYWRYFNDHCYSSNEEPYTYTDCERFLTKEEAEKKVAEEFSKFSLCPMSDVEWFADKYLSNASKSFYVKECDKIYF